MVQEVTNSNLEDDRPLFTQKIDTLNEANQQRHDAIFRKLQKLEEKPNG